jgi:hypothetical protein
LAKTRTLLCSTHESKYLTDGKNNKPYKACCLVNVPFFQGLFQKHPITNTEPHLTPLEKPFAFATDRYNYFGDLPRMKRPEEKETPQCRDCANSHYPAELRGNQPIMEH